MSCPASTSLHFWSPHPPHFCATASTGQESSKAKEALENKYMI